MVHRDVCKDLTVDRDVTLLQAVHQLRIRCSVETGRRIDANDPERTECTLLVTTVTVCILQTLLDVVLGNCPNL